MISSLLLNLVCAARYADGIFLAARRPAGGAESPAQLLLWLLMAVIAVAAVGGAMYFGHRWHQQHSRHSHGALFRGLCDAHGLDRATRRLLTQISRFHRLAQPARLFIEPQWLDPASLGERFNSQTTEMASLRTRLFSVTAASR